MCVKQERTQCYLSLNGYLLKPAPLFKKPILACAQRYTFPYSACAFPHTCGLLPQGWARSVLLHTPGLGRREAGRASGVPFALLRIPCRGTEASAPLAPEKQLVGIFIGICLHLLLI